MQAGSRVKVFPHGAPEQSSLAVIAILSRNTRSIAVVFDEPPIFCKRLLDEGGKIGIDPTKGKVVMLLGRESVGPWIEATGGGHYEIEDVGN